MLEFAERCDLDVTIQIDEAGYGVIGFETSYFELSRLEPASARALWLYLCSRGELSISHGPEVFGIEFRFSLT